MAPMKAVVLTSLGHMELRQVPDPILAQDTDVLLKVDKVGVCGSDVHYFSNGRIGNQVVQFPYIVGHEFSATVIAVGACVSRVKPGDQVAVDPAMACHQCDQCRGGRENTCRNIRFLGCPGQIPGCLCQRLVMPETSLYPIHGRISLEQAVLCEPLSIGIYAVEQARLAPNASLAVLGAGPIGLSILLAAQAQGVRPIYVTDKIPARVDMARQAHAAWAGNPLSEPVVKNILQHVPAGLDAVFECAGQQETLDQAVELLAPGGKLLLVGIPAVDNITLPIHTLRRKEITLINVRRQNDCMQKAIDLLASGRIDMDFMLTHRFPFEQTEQAFALVADYRDGVVKALIEW
jgi:L-iditol 2-dehydrogenase